MKGILKIIMIGFMCVSKAYAGYEVIGETRECAFKAQIIHKLTGQEDSLLVIQGRDVFTIPFSKQVGPIKYYSSFVRGHYNSFITFDAAIMGPEMARLSELRIYLSGVIIDCFIEK